MAGWKIYAVLSGDLVGSKALKKEFGERCLTSLKDTLEDIGKNYERPFLIFRGDSFQGIISVPENALKDGILLRLSLIANSPSDKKKDRMDARIAIGVGTVDILPDESSIGEGDGEAFRNSGMELDGMKQNDVRLAIQTPWPEINDECNIMCSFLDRIIESYTKKQAEAVFLTLKGMKQQEIAERLEISQSGISRRLKDTAHEILEKIVILYSRGIKEKLNQIEKIEDKSSEVEWLLETGRTYFFMSQYEKAMNYVKKALQISREIGDKPGEAKALNNIGLIYGDKGEQDEALQYYQDALKIFREIGDKLGEAKALNNIGLIYGDKGEQDEALQYHQDALKIFREIGDKLGEAKALNNIGLIYGDKGEQDEALKYHQDALKIHRRIGDVRAEGNALGNMGSAYANLGEYRKAMELYEDALKIHRRIGDVQGEGKTLGNMGVAYANLGDKDRAYQCVNEAKLIFEKMGLEHMISRLDTIKKSIDSKVE